MSPGTNGVAAVSQSVKSLGWDMLQHMSNGPDLPSNLALSPLSVTMALGMLAGGQDPSRRKDLCKKLGVEDPSALSNVFSSVQGLSGSKDAQGSLILANATFGDETFSIYPQYAEHLRSFEAHCEIGLPSLKASVQHINSWISDNTLNLINDMLSERMLANAHVVLINALAFKGTWQKQFDPIKTKQNFPFYVSATVQKPVEMMFAYNIDVHVSHGEGYRAVRLTYAGQAKLSLLAYLPDPDRNLQQILPKLRSHTEAFVSTKLTTFGFPKARLSTALDIFSMLSNIGYPLTGDFPEMGPGPNLVEAIFHNATVIINEEGTEAAAATAIMMPRGIRRVDPASELVFSRPFAFSICAEDTKLDLFLGVFTMA